MFDVSVPGREGLTERSKRPPIRLKRVALPNEHGSWGILLEPLVASLTIAASPAGWSAAVIVIGAFLLRQPSKVLVSDLTAGCDLPQTRAAAKFAAAFGSLALMGAAGALALGDPRDLLPLLLLVPIGIFQLYNDVSRNSRGLVPELVGSASISASAPAIALAGGWGVPEALALWALFVCRSVPSVVYVRQRLRLEKGRPFNRAAPAALHLIAVVAVASLASFGLVPMLPIAVFVFLLFRNVTGLSESRRKMKAMQIGIRETIYGGVLVLSVILGHYLGL
ncbi:MAG: YwiC-like family protein [Aridibacter famidurans]|nr:YwiC-like family protein [Aridibacter famidurans]